MTTNTTPGTQQYSGAQRLQVTRKSTLSEATQSAFRQIERWANNLFPSNPAQGQVLTASANHEGRQVLTWASPTSSSGTVLAETVYSPNVGVTYTMTKFMVFLDTTNLTVTFTAPSTGNVDIEVTALCEMQAPGSNHIYCWAAMFDTTSHTKYGPTVTLSANFSGGPAVAFDNNLHMVFPVRGLTSGASATVGLAMAQAPVGVGYSATLLAGDVNNGYNADFSAVLTFSPIIIRVLEMP